MKLTFDMDWTIIERQLLRQGLQPLLQELVLKQHRPLTWAIAPYFAQLAHSNLATLV